jgi:hypothetical protein
MRVWNNVVFPCCSAAVKEFVQRTITQRQAAAFQARQGFFSPCGMIAHQLFTLAKGRVHHVTITRVAVRNRSVQMTDVT